jgi:hypothetical protein
MKTSEIEAIVAEVCVVPPDTLEQLFKTNTKLIALPENVATRVKMEVANLWKPSNQSIDLRYKIDELTIDAHEIGGIKHFMDQSSLREYHQQIKQYQGKYTVGVYTAVKRYFDLNKTQLLVRQQLDQYPVHLIRYGDLAEREEERMNLAINATAFPLSDIEIYPQFRPDEASLGKPILVVTSNISHTGLKLRSKVHFNEKDLICLRFDDLEKDLVFKQKLVTYRVVLCRFSEKHKMFHVMLKLEDIDSNQEFKGYTKNLVYSHKYKYKVDLEHIYDACLSKGFEQYYIDKTRSANVFIDKQGKATQIFCNQQSEELFHSFEMNNHSYLQPLLDKDNVVTYLQQNKYCYYFITRVKMTKSGNTAFVSSIIDGTPDTMALIEKYGKGKASMLFKLSLRSVDETQASKRSTIPVEAQSNYGSGRVHRFSTQALDSVRKNAFAINFLPALDSLVSCLNWSHSEGQIKPAFIFNPETAKPCRLPLVTAEHDDNRCEDRFIFSSPVTVHYKKKAYKGTISNISSLGLCIDLHPEIVIPTSELVIVSLDEFVERTTLYSLGRCEYLVVCSNDRSLRLCNKSFAEHDGRQFLLRYIAAKLDNLKQLDRENEIYGLTRLLRNLSAIQSPNFQLFMYYYRHKLALSAVSVPAYMSRELADMKKRDSLVKTIKQWFYEQDLINVLNDELQDKEKQRDSVAAILVMSFKVSLDELILTKVWRFTEDELTSSSLTNAMRIGGLNGRQIKVYEIKVSNTAKEFKRYYLDELSYIKKYAPHKYKSLRSEITKIKGMAEVTDITTLCEYLPSQM